MVSDRGCGEEMSSGLHASCKSGEDQMTKSRLLSSAPCARPMSAIVLAVALLLAGAGQAQQAPPSKLPLPQADPAPKRIITQGLAKTITEDLSPCAVNEPGMNIRKNPVGEIRDAVHRAGSKQLPGRAEASRSL
jgi:hypothetical protein